MQNKKSRKFKGDNMSVKAKAQKDIFRTEVSLELPVDVSRVNEMMLAMKTHGKMVIVYSQGAHQAVNLEQNSTIPESKAGEMRAMLGIADKQL